MRGHEHAAEFPLFWSPSWFFMPPFDRYDANVIALYTFGLCFAVKRTHWDRER